MAQLQVSFRLSSALQDVVLYESLGDTNSDSALSDSINAFKAVRPSMFTDITVIAIERFWLFASDIFMVCSNSNITIYNIKPLNGKQSTIYL